MSHYFYKLLYKHELLATTYMSIKTIQKKLNQKIKTSLTDILLQSEHYRQNQEVFRKNNYKNF